VADGLIMDTNSNSERYKFVVTMYRYYVSATVVHRGAGAIMYLGGSSWSDPSITVGG